MKNTLNDKEIGTNNIVHLRNDMTEIRVLKKIKLYSYVSVLKGKEYRFKQWYRNDEHIEILDSYQDNTVIGSIIGTVRIGTSDIVLIETLDGIKGEYLTELVK